MRVDQHIIHLLARRRALQLLTVQHLRLQLLPRLHLTPSPHAHLLRAHEGFRTTHVTTAPAGGDQIRHARALEEGVVLTMTPPPHLHLHALVEHLGELLHLHETDANQSRLRVRPVAQRVHEARAQRDDVLERAAELHAHGVVHQRHAEVGGVEQHLELLRVVAHTVAGREGERERLPESGFGELAGGDLIRHVRSAENGAVDVELVVDHAGDQTELAVLVVVHALDARNGVGSGDHVVLDLVQHLREELEVSGRTRHPLGAECRRQGRWHPKRHPQYRERRRCSREGGSPEDTCGEGTRGRVQKDQGYLTFSCSVLMISDSFLSPIISSYTHILMVFSKQEYFLALLPMMMDSAEALHVILEYGRDTSFHCR